MSRGPNNRKVMSLPEAAKIANEYLSKIERQMDPKQDPEKYRELVRAMQRLDELANQRMLF